MNPTPRNLTGGLVLVSFCFLLLLYGTAPSLLTAVAALIGVVIFGLSSFFTTSFLLRLRGTSYLPQLVYPQSKRLRCQLWSGKYETASTDRELIESLTRSYSQLPLILGEKRQQGLIIPAKVDDALEELIDNFLQLYVCSWYVGRVSEKLDFIEEVRHSLACVVRSVYEQLLDIDVAGMLASRVIPLSLKHIIIAKQCSKENNSQQLTAPTNLFSSELSRKILKSYGLCRRIHPACASSASEAAYLRALADVLLARFCSPDLLVPQSSRVFLREALASKMLSLVNFIANPVTVNRLILIWASPGKKFPATVSSWKLLMADFGWRAQRTTPLLCFALAEIRPERTSTNVSMSQSHSRLLYAFQQFLRRRGSKFLDIYLLYQEISIEIIPVFSDARLLATTDVTSESHKLRANSSVRRNLFDKIQELFKAYVDPTAQRSPSDAETADVPVIGADPADLEGVELAKAWQQVAASGQGSLVDPDTVTVFQRIKLHLETRLQPLIHEFNQSDLAVTVFKSVCGAANGGQRASLQIPSKRQIVDHLVKGSYQFSANGKLTSRSSDLSLRTSTFHSVDNLTEEAQALSQISSSHSLAVTSSPQTLSPGTEHQKNQTLSPTYSSTSADSGYNNQQQASSLLVADIPDLSTWRISVPFVEFSPTNRHTLSGSPQSIPIYIVSVRRVDFVSDDDDLDSDIDDGHRFYLPGVLESRNHSNSRFTTTSTYLSSDEQKKRFWNVRRYLDQFYLLEQKLKERYGELIDSSLPPKSRVFVMKEDRAFYEKRRRIFERFLQSLFEKSELRHSRLLYNFLTTDEGFNQRSPGEGSFGRKILRSVLVKESRPLDTFLTGFIQVAEAPSLPSKMSSGMNKGKPAKRTKFESDSDSLLSGNVGSLYLENEPLNDKALFPSDPQNLFGDNAASLLDGSAILDDTDEVYAASSYPVELFDMISSLAVDIISKKFASTESSFQMFSCLTDPTVNLSSFFLRRSLEPLMRIRIDNLLLNTLKEEKVAGWIKTLNESLTGNSSTSSSSISWHSYLQLRAEACSGFVKHAGLPEKAAQVIVDTLQEPIANKQLLYMIIDAIVEVLCARQSIDSVASKSFKKQQ